MRIRKKAGRAPQTPSPRTPFTWFRLISLLSMRPSSPPTEDAVTVHGGAQAVFFCTASLCTAVTSGRLRH